MPATGRQGRKTAKPAPSGKSAARAAPAARQTKSAAKPAAKPAKSTTARSKVAKPAVAKPKSPARAKTASRAASASPAKARGKPVAAKTTARKPAGPARRNGRTGEFSVDRLHQVALLATNLDAAVEFYRGALGLRFIDRFEPPGLAFFNLGGGLRLLLSATASEATLYFRVDDINAAVRTLTRRGVSFLQKPAMVHRDDEGRLGKKGVEEWMAFFRDPSGNLLALVSQR